MALLNPTGPSLITKFEAFGEYVVSLSCSLKIGFFINKSKTGLLWAVFKLFVWTVESQAQVDCGEMHDGDVDTAEDEDEASIGFEFDFGKYGCT